MTTSSFRRCALWVASLAVSIGLCGCGESVEREFRVRVIDPEGRVLRMFEGNTHVFLEDPTSGTIVGHSRTQDDDGWFGMIQTQEDVTLVILSPGCRPEAIANPETDTQVQLARGIPVLIRVHLDGELPQPPLSLELQVEAEGEGEGSAWRASCVAADSWFEPPHAHRTLRLTVMSVDDEIRVWFPHAGRFQIGWMLYERHDVRTPTRTSLGGVGHGPGAKAQIPLDVEDRAGQTFEFHVGAGHLKDMLRFFK